MQSACSIAIRNVVRKMFYLEWNLRTDNTTSNNNRPETFVLPLLDHQPTLDSPTGNYASGENI